MGKAQYGYCGHRKYCSRFPVAAAPLILFQGLTFSAGLRTLQGGLVGSANAALEFRKTRRVRD